MRRASFWRIKKQGSGLARKGRFRFKDASPRRGGSSGLLRAHESILRLSLCVGVVSIMMILLRSGRGGDALVGKVASS